MDRYINTDVGIYHIESVCDYTAADGHKLYHVRCKYCGCEKDIRLFNIKQATVCRHKNRVGYFVKFQPFWQNKKLQYIFSNMKERCFNPNNKSYYWYGARGIRICSEWMENPKLFEEWSLNNGYSEGLTIDRIDVNKDYCPENCQWISMEENSRKAGKVNWITVNGVTLTGKQWADKLNIGTNAINRAIRQHGVDKTKELISAMMKEPPSTKEINHQQSWFSAYGIHT